MVYKIQEPDPTKFRSHRVQILHRKPVHSFYISISLPRNGTSRQQLMSVAVRKCKLCLVIMLAFTKCSFIITKLKHVAAHKVVLA